MIASLILLQTVMHWLFEPVVQLLTPWAGLDVLPWLFAIVGIWIFTGRSGR
ncbi:MAG: hypothetical protein ISR06_03020 [Synechococcus sp. BS30m-G30]|nr:hypothetical protein [Synechococcus sp. BS30m-G30]